MTQNTDLNASGPFGSLSVDKVLRRTLVSATALAIVAIAVAAALGHVSIGLGVGVGLALGVMNALGMRRMVSRMAAMGSANKRAVAGASLSRLGVITMVVFVLLLIDKAVAFGALGGLVAFQGAILANSSKILMGQIRRDSGL